MEIKVLCQTLSKAYDVSSATAKDLDRSHTGDQTEGRGIRRDSDDFDVFIPSLDTLTLQRTP